VLQDVLHRERHGSGVSLLSALARTRTGALVLAIAWLGYTTRFTAAQIYDFHTAAVWLRARPLGDLGAGGAALGPVTGCFSGLFALSCREDVSMGLVGAWAGCSRSPGHRFKTGRRHGPAGPSALYFFGMRFFFSSWAKRDTTA